MAATQRRVSASAVAGRPPGGTGGGLSGSRHADSRHRRRQTCRRPRRRRRPGPQPRGGGATMAAAAAPPQGERPFVPDEIITAFPPGATPQAIDQLARRYNLTQLEFAKLSADRHRLFAGASAAAVRCRTWSARSRTSASSPARSPIIFSRCRTRLPRAAAGTPGDAAQYVLGKLKSSRRITLQRGTTFCCRIDLKIDAKHPDLDGTIVKSFDALGGEENPPRTERRSPAPSPRTASCWASRRAPVLAARAFDDTPGEAKGTSFAIYKGLQWAADNGARIVNMSFAGPADPALHRMLAAAYEKDMVLMAAAGNAGPSPRRCTRRPIPMLLP